MLMNVANAGVLGPAHLASIKKDDGSKPTVKEFQTAMMKPGMDEFVSRRNAYVQGKQYTNHSFQTQTSHINVTAVFYTAMAFLDLLEAGNKKQNVPQDSQVLVTSSIAGFSRQLANGFAYSSSKAGVTHLVKCLSTTFSQNGFHIRVNSISPGLYPSEMTQNSVSALGEWAGSEAHGAFPDAKKMETANCPAERTGSEEDLAGTVLFMASRAGAYLNGETLVSDGGRLGQLPAAY